MMMPSNSRTSRGFVLVFVVILCCILATETAAESDIDSLDDLFVQLVSKEEDGGTDLRLRIESFLSSNSAIEERSDLVFMFAFKAATSPGKLALSKRDGKKVALKYYQMYVNEYRAKTNRYYTAHNAIAGILLYKSSSKTGIKSAIDHATLVSQQAKEFPELRANALSHLVVAASRLGDGELADQHCRELMAVEPNPDVRKTSTSLVDLAKERSLRLLMNWHASPPHDREEARTWLKSWVNEFGTHPFVKAHALTVNKRLDQWVEPSPGGKGFSPDQAYLEGRSPKRHGSFLIWLNIAAIVVLLIISIKKHMLPNHSN